MFLIMSQVDTNLYIIYCHITTLPHTQQPKSTHMYYFIVLWSPGMSQPGPLQSRCESQLGSHLRLDRRSIAFQDHVNVGNTRALRPKASISPWLSATLRSLPHGSLQMPTHNMAACFFKASKQEQFLMRQMFQSQVTSSCTCNPVNSVAFTIFYWLGVSHKTPPTLRRRALHMGVHPNSRNNGSYLKRPPATIILTSQVKNKVGKFK